MFPGAARTQRYRLVNEGRGYELYDMESDPGQKRNVAAERPDVVNDLSAAYDAWHRDVTIKGFTRFPIPVGYDQENPVRLQAPRAYFTAGLRFHGRQGWANDWITGWSSGADDVHWEIDVVQAGNYEVTLGYLCPDADAGSVIQVVAGDARLATKTCGTDYIKHPSLPDRVARTESPERNWAELKFGQIRLKKGRTNLKVTAVTIPGREAIELRYVSLQRMKGR
jgi:arylsulfatase A